MKRSRTKEYTIWLEKAKDDLEWTKANLREEIFYGACFTAHQAIEKALKAYLVYRDGRFGKIHDLVRLIDECSATEKSFRQYRDKVGRITFYYIQTRYPDIAEVERFTRAEAQEAFEIAQEIVNFVSERIRVKE